VRTVQELVGLLVHLAKKGATTAMLFCHAEQPSRLACLASQTIGVDGEPVAEDAAGGRKILDARRIAPTGGRGMSLGHRAGGEVVNAATGETSFQKGNCRAACPAGVTLRAACRPSKASQLIKESGAVEAGDTHYYHPESRGAVVGYAPSDVGTECSVLEFVGIDGKPVCIKLYLMPEKHGKQGATDRATGYRILTERHIAVATGAPGCPPPRHIIVPLLAYYGAGLWAQLSKTVPREEASKTTQATVPMCAVDLNRILYAQPGVGDADGLVTVFEA